MNYTRKILLLFLFCFTTAAAQKDQPNVLSYYAVGNSLDGQLMSEMSNVLRFFPVYAMQQQIDSVRVTVYYGGKIFIRYADRALGGYYWEALLPQFRLGEAIQRLEVETYFRLPERFQRYLLINNNLENSFLTDIDGINIDLQQSEENFKNSKTSFRDEIKEIDSEFKSIGITKSADSDRMRRAYEAGPVSLAHVRDSLVSAYNIEFTSKKGERIEQLAKMRSEKLQQLLRTYDSSQEDAKKKRDELSIAILRMQTLKDSLTNEFAKEIEVNLLDTMYTGPSIRKSDLKIDPDFKHAYLLYRNYKPSLRYMPALDPAERMGIFRVRYVPFPIVGTADRPKATLLKPMSPNSPTVFEVGLAFGDAIVPGDDFVPPEFSWKRLGVAFAITEQLFSEDARIIGLALTYDFNSYGSIGVGGNFAQNETHGYFSLGINKKAFEEVVKGLAKLFH